MQQYELKSLFQLDLNWLACVCVCIAHMGYSCLIRLVKTPLLCIHLINNRLDFVYIAAFKINLGIKSHLHFLAHRRTKKKQQGIEKRIHPFDTTRHRHKLYASCTRTFLPILFFWYAHWI